jgi:pyridoxal 5'-phosphate synthase pdxT subunit
MLYGLLYHFLRGFSIWQRDIFGVRIVCAMVIGILDIQGSVKEHFDMLSSLNVDAKLVRDNFDGIDGLVLPGGESTTISMLLKGLPKDLPIFGTCAGAIILKKLGLLNVDIDRNAYGSQLHSFETSVSVPVLGRKAVDAVFIRAPKFKKIGDGVEILAECESDPVLIRQGEILAATFHPELTSDTRIHEYFLKIVDEHRRNS